MNDGTLAGLIAAGICFLVVFVPAVHKIVRHRPHHVVVRKPAPYVKTPAAVRRARAPQRKATRARKRGLRH